MDDSGLAACGHCGRSVVRLKNRMDSEYAGIPLVYSRTLVQGRFLPSCSEPCAGNLRASIGDRPRTVNRVSKYAI